MKKTKKAIKKPKVKILKNVGRPMTLPPFWTALAKDAGGVAKLGNEIGRAELESRGGGDLPLHLRQT